MAKYRITYPASMDKEPEDVEADSYSDQGGWIDFTRFADEEEEMVQVLRVKASNVVRVERLSE